jgi:hypothetical protein
VSSLNLILGEPEIFDEHDYAASDRAARGRRPVFEYLISPCILGGDRVGYITSILGTGQKPPDKKPPIMK